MSRILFLPLALAETPRRSAGPLSLPAAARQIPRLVAELVGRAASDRWQCGYMPLVGNEDGRRGFVTFGDLLPLEQIESVLGPQPVPDLLVDGRLSPDSASLRALAPVAGTVLLELEDLPFDPQDARILLNRMTIELWDVMDLPGRPAAPPEMPKEALAFYLAGRDEELALAANLTRPSPRSPFAPLLAGLQHAPGNEAIASAVSSVARLVIEQGRGDPRDAAAALVRAARGGTTIEFLRGAMRLVRAAGDGSAFESIGTAYLRQEPGDAEVAWIVGSGLAARGRGEAAREILTECVQSWRAVPEPQGPHILALLIEICTERGADREADRWAMQLAALEGLPAHAAEVLARRLTAQGRPDAATDVLRTALADHPGSASLQLELGRAAIQQGDIERARAALYRAREGDELTRAEAERFLRFVQRPELQRLLEDAEGALAENEPRCALRLARRAARAAPDLPESWYAYGLARSALGHRRRAVRAMRQALALLPDFDEARNRLGILLVGLGRFEEGYAELARVLEERSDQLGPLLHMAQACYYLEKHDEGASVLARAEELFPDHPAVEEARATFYPPRR